MSTPSNKCVTILKLVKRAGLEREASVLMPGCAVRFQPDPNVSGSITLEAATAEKLLRMTPAGGGWPAFWRVTMREPW